MMNPNCQALWQACCEAPRDVGRLQALADTFEEACDPLAPGFRGSIGRPITKEASELFERYWQALIPMLGSGDYLQTLNPRRRGNEIIWFNPFARPIGVFSYSPTPEIVVGYRGCLPYSVESRNLHPAIQVFNNSTATQLSIPSRPYAYSGKIDHNKLEHLVITAESSEALFRELRKIYETAPLLENIAVTHEVTTNGALRQALKLALVMSSEHTLYINIHPRLHKQLGYYKEPPALRSNWPK